MKNLAKHSLLILLLLCACTRSAKASHLYGGDFYYTYVNDTTYNLTLVMYGDCTGSAFSTFPTATPNVYISRNGVTVDTVVLSLQAPINGVEVSPVCPSQINNTGCSVPQGTLPGVKRFTYSGTVKLRVKSSSWVFLFDAYMAPSSTAGRSGSITNLGGAGPMCLRATLDNTSAGNSSPTYTTIPTPFFCEFIGNSFNPGTVDANGDSLVYELVPGLVTMGGTVFYAPGYTATAPLSVTAGTFSFSSSTGQLSFTPNRSQISLVAYRVSEYRNGTLIGTSMREMNFVVVPCTNTPPNASITNVTNATAVNTVSVSLCADNSTVGFNLNPTDPNGDNVNVSVTGLPSGASFTITGNNTTSPSCNFSWNTTGVASGRYTFYVTYTDNGCPMVSKQTIAYTVIINPVPKISFTQVSAATCFKKAVFSIGQTASGSITVRVLQSGSLVRTLSSTTNSLTDSLPAGIYTFRVINATGCYSDTTVNFVSPALTQVSLALDLPSCNQFSDGAIHITASSGNAPYQYALNAGTYGSTAQFASLASGSYVVHVKDAIGCLKDTVINLDDSIRLQGSMSASNITCNALNNGSITITGISSAYGGPYIYLLNGNVITATTISNLPAATYIVRAQDVKGCYMQDTFIITEPMPLVPSATANNITCHGEVDGFIAVPTTGGTPAYTYIVNGGTPTNDNIYTGLPAGTYIIKITDANGCTEYDTAVIYEPKQLAILNTIVTYPTCYGTATGKVLFTMMGGTPMYTYATGGNSFTDTVTGLSAGTHAVHITDVNGCAVDTNIVLTDPARIVITSAIDKPTCAQLPNGQIALSATGGFAPYTYAVNDSNFTSIDEYKQLPAGNYIVRVKDVNNCIVDSTIALRDSLNVKINSTTTNALCYGDANGSVNITATGGAGPYSIAFAGGAYGDKINYTGYTAGQYSIYAKDALGCLDTSNITITQPDVLVSTSDIINNNCYGNTLTSKVTLNAKGGTLPYKYLWSNGTTTADNSISALANGNYTMYVKDANGCADTVAVLLEYTDCCTPFIPSAFTPNGDGRNDVFRLVSKGDIRLEEMVIFNRWGQRMFTSSDIANSWDGSFNGTPQDAGVYYYHLKARCGNNNEQLVELQGDVTLVR